jgi:enoyl-[acyl-carrier protein] reductase III
MELSRENPGVVFVVGISGVLGMAIAEKMAMEGYRVYGMYRGSRMQVSETEVWWASFCERYPGFGGEIWNSDALKVECRVELIRCLVSLGLTQRISVLVHSLAKGNLKPMLAEEAHLRLSEKDLLLTIEAMGTNWFSWVQEFMEAGLFAPSALNIALSSMGSERVWPNYAAVGMAKAVLNHSAMSMAASWACCGIRTNVLVPGVVDTPAFRKIPGQLELMRKAKEHNPMGRITEPKDVANVVYLLSRPEASFVNGAVLHVDGGEHLLV